MEIHYGDWLRRARQLLALRYKSAKEGGGAGAGWMSPAVLEQALTAECPPVLIDIRSAAAFANGHLPGALNIPLDELASGIARLDQGAPTVVY